MIDIGDDLSKVANMLVKTALSPLIGENDRQELFKLLTAYHLGICKVGKKNSKEEDDGSDSFDQFRQRVASSVNTGNGADSTTE